MEDNVIKPDAFNSAPAAEEEIELDTYHFHEALDRTFVAMETFSEYVSNHPALEYDPQVKAAADEIVVKLYNLYNLIQQASDKFSIEMGGGDD